MIKPSQASRHAGKVCDFVSEEYHWKCNDCGIKIPLTVFPAGKPYVLCRGARRKKDSGEAPPEIIEKYVGEPARGLGDMVADGLSAVGITKERVAALAGKKDCGCAQRQAYMNAWAHKHLGMPAGRMPAPPAPASEIPVDES